MWLNNEGLKIFKPFIVFLIKIRLQYRIETDFKHLIKINYKLIESTCM